MKVYKTLKPQQFLLLCSTFCFLFGAKVYGATEKTLDLSGINVKGDYSISEQYSVINVDNVVISGELKVLNNADTPLEIIVSSNSKIGTITKYDNVNIVNNGQIANINIPPKFVTGLVETEDGKYFHDENGENQTGFVDIEGKKYYFNPDGKMLLNGWIEDYKAQANGELYYTKTGDAQVDAEIDVLLKSIIKDSKTEKEKMAAVYVWMRNNFRWRVVPVDISGGYTDAKVLEIAKYSLDNMAGSCEQFACLEGLLLRRMGYPTEVISGNIISTGSPHSWIRIDIDGQKLHFDPQTRITTSKDKYMYFLKTDAEFKNHKW